jgi:adenylate cyclase
VFRPKETSPLSIQLSNVAQQVDEVLAQMRKGNVNDTLVDKMTQLSIILGLFKRQISENEEELRSLRALTGIGEVVNSSLDLDVVMRIVLDTLIRLVVAERGFLMLPNEQGEMVIHMARNWEQNTVSPDDYALSTTIILKVTSERKPILTTNAQQDPRFGNQESIVTHNLRSIMCVPMVAKNAIIGVIYVDNRIRSGIFTHTELDLLTGFANQASVAIENARIFASLKRTLAEVTELKQMMDNVFSSITSGVIMADIEEKVRLCNHAAEAILGSTAANLVGFPVDGILPPVGPALQPRLTEVVQKGKPVLGLELNPVLPDRGQVNLLVNLSPFKDENNTTQGVTIMVDDVTEKKRHELQTHLFEHKVAPEIIQQIDTEKLQLEGMRTDLTVLCAGLYGFTSFGEGLPAELLVSILNKHLSAATEAILIEGGTIDKLLGDTILAWFNAPVAQANHPLRAVKAALGIRKAMTNLHEGYSGNGRLSFGIGIHGGDVVLGLLDIGQRMEYSAVGECLSTTGRIQEQARPGQILVSAQIFKKVR